jgi:peptidoglycan/LPS O-acetylase OafA/YrhL
MASTAPTNSSHEAGPPPDREFRLGYRPALDGLRIFLTLPVLLAHGGVQKVGGANFAIDVFFTLSGFLITGVLLEEWRSEKRIRLKDFYWRRAARLFPALFLVLAAWALYAFCANRKEELLFVVYVFFYIANWVRAFHYAGSDGLGHTWSLSIEEQFYLVWPPILIWLLKSARSRLFTFIFLGAGVLVIAIWRGYLWQTGSDIHRLYNGTDTRADALLVGCALAFVVYAGCTKRWNYWLATPCFLLLFYAIIFDLDKRFWLRDGGGVLVALAAAGLVWGLVSPGEQGVLRRALASAPLVWAGKISYGLYVWHLPVYYLIGRQQLAWPLFYLVVIKIAATAVLATLSYYYVERPIQRWAKRRSKTRRDTAAPGGT